MHISKDVKDRIFSVAKLEDFMSLKGRGKTKETPCPKCEKKMQVTPAKQIAKCFHCDNSYSNPVSYLMDIKNLSYPEALEEVAKHYLIDLETDAEKRKRLKSESKTKRVRQDNFCDQQLKSSGLEYSDIEVEMIDDDGTRRTVHSFRSGTRNQYDNIVEGKNEADMLIYYYDLEGRLVMYKHPKRDKMLPLIRVRWSVPENHLGRDGKPIKYQSPLGSGTHIYIPQKIRNAYKTRTKIKRLYIQEGEKKAEKACKHGIMSLGIMGIQNIGGKAKVLPTEIQIIAQTCEVEEVVFLLDSDWSDLSSNLTNGKNVDMRPRQFFYAVRNFKEYMRNLANVNCPVEIYFAHINPNTNKDKGVDDLLAGSLAGNEKELNEDIEWAINEKEKKGKHITLYKITTLTDKQIADFWCLNSKDDFFKRHKERLQTLKEFVFGKSLYRFNDKNEIELAQALRDDEKFWDTYVKKNSDVVEYSFKYVRALRFLANRGIGLFQKFNGDYEYVHIENRIINKINQLYVRRFILDFVRLEISNEEIEEMLIKGGKQYLGPEILNNLDVQPTIFSKPSLTSQNLYFKDEVWEATADGIKKNSYGQIPYNLWKEQIIDFEAKHVPDMITVNALPDGNFDVILSEEAKKCHFLNFLLNASNITWKKKKEDITKEDILLQNRHFLNKMTAIGYMLHEYRNKSEEVAVIAMDAKLSEVGESNGRSGKSLVGVAIEQVIPQAYINGKAKDMTSDKWLFEDVNEATRNIFVDDARTNIDFEFWFPLITGKMKASRRGEHGQTLVNPPKVFMTTNHAINGTGASYKDRQAFMAFSDYYNDNHKPIDDFGINFFSEWGFEQWNLFYNFMATCMQLYFASIANGWGGRNKGIVAPPMGNLERRRLRQQIGEETLQWLDEYFGIDEFTKPSESTSENMNKQISRKQLWEDFQTNCKTDAKYTTANGFKNKILAYASYRRLNFNPKKRSVEHNLDFVAFKKDFPDRLFVGQPDKSGGVEYFTVANENYQLPTKKAPY